MGFDKEEWKEMLQLADDLDPTTRMLLFQYSMLLDSQGRATTQLKILSRTVSLSEKAVRKLLLKAKDAQWLEAITIDGRKGYQATLPADL